MSWAKLDDRANEHEKQLAAGPKACWLWACGLMYCNRQSKKTGRIPKIVVHGGMLFPGTGKVDAKRLVEVGLWHEDGDSYDVHQYHGWNPELSTKRAEAGRAGGKASGEARREATSKQLASIDEANEPSNPEAPDEASGVYAHSRARTHAQPRAGSTPPHPTPPHAADPEQPQSCPSDLRLTEAQRGTLATGGNSIPDWAIDEITRRFVSKAVADPSDKRTPVHWLKCLASAVAGDWSNPTKRPKKPDASADGAPRMQLPEGMKLGAEGL